MFFCASSTLQRSPHPRLRPSKKFTRIAAQAWISVPESYIKHEWHVEGLSVDGCKRLDTLCFEEAVIMDETLEDSQWTDVNFWILCAYEKAVIAMVYQEGVGAMKVLYALSLRSPPRMLCNW